MVVVAEQVLVDPCEVVSLLAAEDVGGWGGLEDPLAQVSWEQSLDTEWHQVLMLSCPAEFVSHARLVVHVPSCTGAALDSKALASRLASDAGLGPRLLADLTANAMCTQEARQRRLLVSEHLPGGTLQADDVRDGDTMAEVGRLYGRFHYGLMPSTWFNSIQEDLELEGATTGRGGEGVSWASCLWVLSSLLRQVPANNRSALEAVGVDWGFIASEIDGLPSDAALPSKGVLGRTVTVHGDSHLGNILRDADDRLRLIDFDMTARGPAGSEFGFLTLMLFRCGFAPELIVPRDVQRRFCAGYLETLGCNFDGEVVDDLLLDMHCWGYTGLLKMGLLCAVLMSNGGHAAKRQVMRARGPTLLNRDFLLTAKALIRRAGGGDVGAKEALLSQGIFFATEATRASSAA